MRRVYKEENATLFTFVNIINTQKFQGYDIRILYLQPGEFLEVLQYHGAEANKVPVQYFFVL